ncbi:hypothetical protein [Arthrobacter bambusae]|uniref:Uncharacterized protein n=1 Tax=Arthrobacter bambusae TaxID=1338426 RepID=A0AAW8DCV6_9MICC|nr:hypothetical protein [Arthrobacter bambusae]MDP9903256.1 hypothetical protein [Arthrobacter bambusae]MDQ0128750.1 hypothetical protein [Arthrobacter bambusae]MDQ0180091.1 hypothetical protein [Arthrobacter bambusae]
MLNDEKIAKSISPTNDIAFPTTIKVGTGTVRLFEKELTNCGWFMEYVAFYIDNQNDPELLNPIVFLPWNEEFEVTPRASREHSMSNPQSTTKRLTLSDDMDFPVTIKVGTGVVTLTEKFKVLCSSYDGYDLFSIDGCLGGDIPPSLLLPSSAEYEFVTSHLE